MLLRTRLEAVAMADREMIPTCCAEFATWVLEQFKAAQVRPLTQQRRLVGEDRGPRIEPLRYVTLTQAGSNNDKVPATPRMLRPASHDLSMPSVSIVTEQHLNRDTR